MSNIAEITEIFARCIKGTATQSERTFFYDWAELPENRAQAVQLWETAFANSDGSLDMDTTKGEGIFEAILNTSKAADSLHAIHSSAPPVHRVHFLKTAWFRYAAVLILLVGGYYMIKLQAGKDSNPPRSFSANQPILSAPDRNKAILTLSDGSSIILDSAGNGWIASDHNAKAVLKDGRLIYQPGAGDLSGKLVYNTLKTPRGGNFRLILPDGTKVWLNAASSLRYPTAFTGTERIVEMTGEAYFEIAPDAIKTFKVKALSQEIAVLGTHFNINAYEDETAIKTTLLEGRIKVSCPGLYPGASAASVVVYPGQQSSFDLANGKMSVAEVDVKESVAWKDGVFLFREADIHTIMRQVSRWYDVQVTYKGNVDDIQLSGALSRKEKVEDLLKVLQMTKQVHFILQGNQITVVPH